MAKPKDAPAVRSRRLSDEPLTPATIQHTAFAIRKGYATPEDARRLLQAFIDSVPEGDRHDFTPRSINQFLAQTFSAYLQDPRSGRLESLLGLLPPAHRAVSPDIQRRNEHLSLRVLQLRLAGKAAKAAYDLIGGEEAVSRKTVEDAFRDHAEFALTAECDLRRLRGLKPPLFTESESLVLKKIFRGSITD